MRRHDSLLLASALAFAAIGASAKQPDSELPACVQARAFARYGAYGYDHIVTIDNACDRAAACVVSTNVNPDSIDVRVEPGTRESVMTFRGSPARQFTANVRCKLTD